MYTMPYSLLPPPLIYMMVADIVLLKKYILCVIVWDQMIKVPSPILHTISERLLSEPY